ncbi:MAG TPA: hypothetical protein VF450_06730, partial [Noviherbaspirillum sp.]
MDQDSASVNTPAVRDAGPVVAICGFSLLSLLDERFDLLQRGTAGSNLSIAQRMDRSFQLFAHSRPAGLFDLGQASVADGGCRQGQYRARFAFVAPGFRVLVGYCRLRRFCRCVFHFASSAYQMRFGRCSFHDPDVSMELEARNGEYRLTTGS